MGSESRWVIERFGSRGARVALAASGLIFIVLILAWAAVAVMASWRGGHELRALLQGALALLLVGLSLRVMAVNWRATRGAAEPPVPSAEGGDQTGIWGVGGPSMRQPGSTGIWPQRHVDRRYDSEDD